MIIIHDYNPLWPAEFEQFRLSLIQILGQLALQIDHIGSTAVPGLAAKDVIDIQVTVAELRPEITNKLVAAGYQHLPHITHDHLPPGGDPRPERWAKLIFIQPEGGRRVNIHVRPAGNPNQQYPLLFRDYLRQHPNAAKAIETIKRQLAKYHPNDVEAYYDIKDPVYDLIWDAALEWENNRIGSTPKD